MVQGERVLTVGQLAKLLCVDRSTIYRWIAKGEVPTFQLGGRTRISLSQLRATLPAVYEAIQDQRSDPDPPAHTFFCGIASHPVA
jgi:excisionase family DNA binding protein